ncbi:MAG: hypothetical protein J0L53_12045 [Spirochaetes bacterium]|nr:hypothetical protein [Spirochaetota bacterium]
MSLRNLSILLIAAGGIAAIIFFLRPCGPGTPQTAANGLPVNAPQPVAGTPQPAGLDKKLPPAKAPETEKVKPVLPADKSAPVEKNLPPAANEVDNTPPVNLTGSETIPDIGRCATRNFPSEAAPYVKMATVTVRLVVDRFGNVRSDTPISVEFPPEVDEEQIPAMRKLFIKAGARAFGAKKCPPHIVNGQSMGYSIEVPLQYSAK